MPCFKGLAVSIHTSSGPIAEHSVQKQMRNSRISCYIPVPPPKYNPGSQRPELSSFAISITLLTPGSTVPYSRPDPTSENPHPSPTIVGGLTTQTQRGRFTSFAAPYQPLTFSPNETIAAYIHFDGRAKEEVATLLRRGVETWVNSRWVGVPASEGGGLAEREFLFREVGLERWLNGLDLQGASKDDVAAKIERRKQKLEKKRRKRLGSRYGEDDGDHKDALLRRSKPLEKDAILRYGSDKSAPIEDVMQADDDEDMSSSDDSDDEIPEVEATGQIKVSLFRVMASGEIKKGEYSPSFDAHDDDDESMQEQNGEDPNVDHTTTFAKPKTLDAKSISTQTVTGIDDPSKPFATFTFFYRSERQLQKMGIIPYSATAEAKKSTTAKRKSRQMDFSNLPPLKKEGGAGFAGWRDSNAKPTIPNLNGKRNVDDDVDSDEEGMSYAMKKKSPSPPTAVNGTSTNGDNMDDDSKVDLSPEEAAKRGELAEGMKKIQLKRQHSSEALVPNGQPPKVANTDVPASEIASAASPTLNAGSPTFPSLLSGSRFGSTEATASPFKKQRASVSAAPPSKPFASQVSPSAINFSAGSPDVAFTSNQQQSTFLPSTSPPANLPPSTPLPSTSEDAAKAAAAVPLPAPSSDMNGTGNAAPPATNGIIKHETNEKVDEDM